MTNTEIIKDFLFNNEKQSAIINEGGRWGNYKKLFYKLNIQTNFDFVYCCELRNDAPRIDGEASKNEFCGIINRNTNKLYFARYGLYCYFDKYRNPDGEPLQYVKYEDIINAFNNAVIAKYEELAQNVADDMQETPDFQYIKSDAPNIYFYDKANPYHRTPGTSNERTTDELLQYIENPTQAIKNLFAKLEQDTDENRRPTDAIKYNKLVDRIYKQELQRIETAPEFKELRQAKEIKNSIPEDAKQLTIIYKLSNGETLTGKMLAQALTSQPYGLKELNYSSYSMDAQSRNELKRVEGCQYDDIYIKNIIKITYKGKTIYANPDHTDKEGA